MELILAYLRIFWYHFLTMNKETINIIEIFGSVQGETSFSGLPTTFIRLAQCNLRCTWCDTAYSFGRGTPFEMQQIIDQVQKNGHPYVCMTGGEPLLQKNVFPLMTTLCDLGYQLSLETGGSLSTKHVDPRVHTILDIKCPGSGMENKNHWENIDYLKTIDEVKFVIADEKDYFYATELVNKYQLHKRVREVLFSPVFGILDPKILVEWILRDRLPVRLNLQIHKFIWSPSTKGV